MHNRPSKYSLFSTSHFFKTHFKQSFTTLNLSIDPNKISLAKKHREKISNVFKQKYPSLRRHTFETESKFAYTLSNESPNEVITAASFLPPDEEPKWVGNDPYHPDFGNNSGMVCFSFLPEVTALFAEMLKENSNKPLFMYAYLLNKQSGEVIFPGGRWRQVCIPGRLPIYPHSFLLARELINIQEKNQIILGPIIDVTGLASKWQNQLSSCYLMGERFEEYCKGDLVKPASRYFSEMDLDYEIIDTSWTDQFQCENNSYYQKIFRESLSY